MRCSRTRPCTSTACAGPEGGSRQVRLGGASAATASPSACSASSRPDASHRATRTPCNSPVYGFSRATARCEGSATTNLLRCADNVAEKVSWSCSVSCRIGLDRFCTQKSKLVSSDVCCVFRLARGGSRTPVPQTGAVRTLALSLSPSFCCKSCGAALAST